MSGNANCAARLPHSGEALADKPVPLHRETQPACFSDVSGQPCCTLPLLPRPNRENEVA